MTTWDGPKAVYRYAAPHRWDGRTVDVDEHTLGQLRLAHDLRNKRVELWNSWQEAVGRVWLSRVDIAELTAPDDGAGLPRWDARCEELSGVTVAEMRQWRRYGRFAALAHDPDLMSHHAFAGASYLRQLSPAGRRRRAHSGRLDRRTA
jgi:hypothetical protein